MPTPAELSAAPSTASYLTDPDFEAFAPEVGDESDGVYAEITERRAQLENAEILRFARAL